MASDSLSQDRPTRNPSRHFQDAFPRVWACLTIDSLESQQGGHAQLTPRQLHHKPLLLFFHKHRPGESANAVPHYHKLCSRVSHIWGNRRGQHIRSAMDKPRPGKTTIVIMVSPLPGKYELLGFRPTATSYALHRTHTLTSPHHHPRAFLALPHSASTHFQAKTPQFSPTPRETISCLSTR